MDKDLEDKASKLEKVQGSVAEFKAKVDILESENKHLEQAIREINEALQDQGNDTVLWL